MNALLNESDYRPEIFSNQIPLLHPVGGYIPLRLLEGRGFSPTWSPDNEWIAFTKGGVDRQLFKIRRDGSDLQQLTDLDCDIKVASWSPR
ncbi:MAG: hypothetical protein OXG78_10890 [Chloroflexi bacterium]|nr:hypothetical protein [Chloroflexota bacterium]